MNQETKDTSPNKLENLMKSEKGSAAVTILAATAILTPICAYAGSRLGEGAGYILGNIVDFIPLVNDVAPWLAERSGLINDAKNVVDLNENLYQTTGAIGGFWGGMAFPWKMVTGNW